LLLLAVLALTVPATMAAGPVRVANNDQPVVLEVLPNTGPVGGVVAVSGTGIGEGTQVYFGDIGAQLAAPIQCHPFPRGCTISVLVPPQPDISATVCVRVVTLDQVSECTEVARFTYINGGG
jgi:hypothetical protein